MDETANIAPDFGEQSSAVALTARVLRKLNESGDDATAIREELLAVKAFTGIEAAGIRLREGHDFPYYEVNGFPQDFLQAENFLCACGPGGEPLLDAEGFPVLECMCGNIIRGRTDPRYPFFTKGGSFWSNCTTDLLASTTEKERQARTRNRCNREGYESVALIPLRSHRGIVGLLQLNDTRKGMFSQALITFLEGICASIGVALRRKRAEEEMKESEDKFRYVFDNSPVGKSLTLPSGRVNANKALSDMLGYSQDEMNRHKWQDLTHPDDIELTAKALDLLKSGERDSVRFTKRYIHRNGSVVWGDLSTSLRRDDSGKPLYFMSTLVDITERVQAEERIARLNAVLRGVRNVNQLITREKDREALIKRACELLVEARGFHAVVIGLLDGKGTRIASWAGAGDKPDVLRRMLDRGELPPCAREALGKPGVTVRSGPSVACRDCPAAQSPPVERDGAAVRIEHAGRIYGVLVASVPPGIVNDPEEQGLLSEVAGDIGFALHGVELEAEKARAEETIRDLARIPEENPNPVMRVTPAGVVIFANPAAQRMLAQCGLGEGKELPGHALEILREPISRKEPSTVEFECMGRDLSFAVAPVPERGYANLYVRDITERKRAEQALQATEKRYRRLFEAARDGILILDADTGMVLDVNPFLVELLGYSHETFLGKHLWEIGQFRDIAASKEAFKALQEKEYVRYEDLPLETSDGRRIDVEFVSNAYLVDHTKVFQCNIRDVTQRKRAEEALRTAEERYRTILQGAAEGILVADIETKRFVYANPAICRMLGYTEDELKRMGVGDIHPPQDLPHVVGEFEAQARGEKVVAPAIPCRRKDGATLYADVTTAMVVLDGRKCNVGFFSDLTERRRAEEKLLSVEEQFRQAQKLEAVGRLAGGIAHDFNNMLGAIIGYSDLILGGTREGDPMRGDLAQIKRAAERAAALTRQLLAFSRKQVLDPRVLDLNELVSDMEKMLHRLIGEDIDLATSFAKDLGKVRADPGQMEQVLMNLVVNARDAMPEGGRLTIETANVDLDEEYVSRHQGVAPGPYVMFAVTDTGCGMDEATKSRLFEPFFTTKAPGKGTGLGLSTVYGIVQQSGGSIWVYSEPGRGSTFKVYLPRVDAEARSAEGSPGLKAALRAKRSETVLVVEDEDALRVLARRILAVDGYRVLEASGGGEALKVCAEHKGPIHLMLTDVVMPDMNGAKLAERVRAVRPRMKVLFMSGYADDAVTRSGELRFDAPFIQKPFSASGLLAKVQGILDEPDSPEAS